METIIDLDSDSVNNVEIPIPENLAKKPRASKRSKSNKNFSLKTYIYIDDDDDESPKNNNHQAETCDTKSNDAAKHSPVKLSRSKRTYPGKGPNNGNVDPSANNVSACESKIESKGTLQKLWEKASLKKNDSVQSECGSNSIQVFNEKEGQCGFGHKDEKSKEIVISNEMDNERKLKAEEAQRLQRLLKRKEAEKSRLLDIERRQKQRVKEVRETQKKVEANMKLKEIYRTKVQQNLKKLEMTCHDMASLLRALGILVNNDPYASSNQIHAAYKRALLRFHPDRVSGTDMHQQVEAEEKFKLISRMRDKFGNLLC